MTKFITRHLLQRYRIFLSILVLLTKHIWGLCMRRFQRRASIVMVWCTQWIGYTGRVVLERKPVNFGTDSTAVNHSGFILLLTLGSSAKPLCLLSHQFFESLKYVEKEVFRENAKIEWRIGPLSRSVQDCCSVERTENCFAEGFCCRKVTVPSVVIALQTTVCHSYQSSAKRLDLLLFRLSSAKRSLP